MDKWMGHGQRRQPCWGFKFCLETSSWKLTRVLKFPVNEPDVVGWDKPGTRWKFESANLLESFSQPDRAVILPNVTAYHIIYTCPKSHFP